MSRRERFDHVKVFGSTIEEALVQFTKGMVLTVASLPLRRLAKSERKKASTEAVKFHYLKGMKYILITCKTVLKAKTEKKTITF